MTKAQAVVLLSGGIDSATTLALATEQGYYCHALSVMYGQRHAAELEAARAVARVLGAAEHKIIHLGLGTIGGSALTDPSIPVPVAPTPRASRPPTCWRAILCCWRWLWAGPRSWALVTSSSV